MAEPPPRGGGSIREHGLAAHLRDAVRLNRARRPAYARLGGARAWALSTALISAERALLPAASLLDRQAAPFVEAGVPILVADLMPMPSGDGPPRLRPSPPPGQEGTGVVDRPERSRLGGNAEPTPRRRASPPPRLPAPLLDRRGATEIRSRLGAARQAVRAECFPEAADLIRQALDAVRVTEAETGRVLALTAHVLESAGLMALRAPGYAAASGGATVPLSRRLVAGHLPLVPLALRLDAWAHPVQACGVGLFVDDLPPIPFEAEHDAHA